MNVPCPAIYANVVVAERFGHFPWELEDAPLDRLLLYFNVLGVEAETMAALDGLSREEPLIFEGED